MLAELDRARSRRLETSWLAPAVLTFTMNGRSDEVANLVELATDVVAWRWDEYAGADVAVFRGVISHSEDQLTEQSHTVNFTAHDYSALLGRRYLTSTLGVLARDQDLIVNDLVVLATTNAASSSGASFSPASFLPLYVVQVNPDGSTRPTLSGQLRDRTYYGSQEIGAALNDLAKVIGGFGYAVAPFAGPFGQWDALNVYYPSQGTARPDVALVYGGNVSTVTRTVDSSTYANYQRCLGNNGSSDPNAPQLYAEAWNSDANNVTVNPVGLWQATDNAADVNVQATLAQKAQGDLNLSGLLVPSYTLTVRPGRYRYGYPRLGDTVPLVVKSGRLNVNTTVQVVGLNYAISDDADEVVELTVGRPPALFADLFTQADRDVDALTRR
jgi:hypothetical protein